MGEGLGTRPNSLCGGSEGLGTRPNSLCGGKDLVSDLKTDG